MIGILLFAATIAAAVFLFVQQTSFGKRPEGDRLERIKESPNYQNGSFKNLSETTLMSAETSYLRLIKMQLWKENPTEPDTTLPAVKEGFKASVSGKPEITWLGHSTLLIQINGKNILVDPVLSERASPVQYAGSKNYEGTNVYSISDLPAIDYVIISHDHYDHLDHASIDQLKDSTKMFIMPLGVGAHLESWGVNSLKVRELDWWEEVSLEPGIHLIATPARHFSGRGITDKNKTLWASYVLLTPEYKIYIGGDSGYDKHFKEIGEKYGPFDVVFLEAGQYHEYWPYIHMMPEETVQASIDLKGKVLLPVHWGKFTLALHTWNDPVIRVMEKAKELNIRVSTPLIGEKVIIDSLYPDKKWWTGL